MSYKMVGGLIWVNVSLFLKKAMKCTYFVANDTYALHQDSLPWTFQADSDGKYKV